MLQRGRRVATGRNMSTKSRPAEAEQCGGWLRQHALQVCECLTEIVITHRFSLMSLLVTNYYYYYLLLLLVTITRWVFLRVGGGLQYGHQMRILMPYNNNIIPLRTSKFHLPICIELYEYLHLQLSSTSSPPPPLGHSDRDGMVKCSGGRISSSSISRPLQRKEGGSRGTTDLQPCSAGGGAGKNL